MAAVRILKLVTGDDVIGIISEAEIDKDRKVIEVKAPHFIMMRPKKDSDNEYVLGLTPYAPYAKNSTIAIIPTHVISICDPNEDLWNEYKKRFADGVVETSDKTVKQVLKEG